MKPLFEGYVSEARFGIKDGTPTLHTKSYSKTFVEYSLSEDGVMRLADSNFATIAKFQPIADIDIEEANWAAQALAEAAGSTYTNLFNVKGVDVMQQTKIAYGDINGDDQPEIFVTFDALRNCPDDNVMSIYDGNSKGHKMTISAHTDTLKICTLQCYVEQFAFQTKQATT